MKVQKTHSDKWYNRNSEISRPPRAVKRELKGREYSHSKLKNQANNYNGYYRCIKRKVIVSQGEKDGNRIMTPPMKTYPLAVGGDSNESD